MSRKILGGIFSAIGLIVTTAAGVTPQDAVSNIAAWLKLIGFEKVPQGLSTHAADNWGLFSGSLILIFGIYLLWCRSKNEEPISDLISENSLVTPINIEVGEGRGFYEISRGAGIYSHKRTLMIKISNVAASQSLNDCRVHIREISNCEYHGPWVLAQNLSISSGDHVFIPLVTYGEAADIQKFDCGDTFMIFQTIEPRPQPSPSIDVEHEVLLRVTARDVPYKDFKCMVHVDDNGQLRIRNSN